MAIHQSSIITNSNSINILCFFNLPFFRSSFFFCFFCIFTLIVTHHIFGWFRIVDVLGCHFYQVVYVTPKLKPWNQRTFRFYFYLLYCFVLYCACVNVYGLLTLSLSLTLSLAPTTPPCTVLWVIVYSIIFDLAIFRSGDKHKCIQQYFNQNENETATIIYYYIVICCFFCCSISNVPHGDSDIVCAHLNSNKNDNKKINRSFRAIQHSAKGINFYHGDNVLCVAFSLFVSIIGEPLKPIVLFVWLEFRISYSLRRFFVGIVWVFDSSSNVRGALFFDWHFIIPVFLRHTSTFLTLWIAVCSLLFEIITEKNNLNENFTNIFL